MASEKLIKRRIKSAKNIAQITKAMQMVAASKMKKAQTAALSGRPYAEKISEMVKRLVVKIDQSKHPLLRVNPTGKNLIILISTNKGLCGGLNTNLFRSLTQRFSKDVLNNSIFVTIGKKGENFLVRSKLNLQADFSQQQPFSLSIPALTTLIIEGFTKGEYREVFVVYSNFISALKQEPMQKRILPIVDLTKSSAETHKSEELEFLVEPSVDAILDTLLLSFLENQIRDAVYEAEASEHSARMVAMKNATDNANDFITLLTLEYNKARQEKITYEIADMVTARLAIV